MSAPSTKVNPGLRAKRRYKLRIMFVLWTFWFAYLALTYEVEPVESIPMAAHSDWISLKGRLLKATAALQATTNSSNDLEYSLVPGYNCTNPAILEFPQDLFSQKERQSGAIVIHFLASLYVFYAFAIICDDYFVPSIESICEELSVPSDVAGATFMAIATSSPELFTNVVGTFITQGDIGLGAIVGSAVFNILAVCACCGFAASAALPLDWYPLTRDCIFYTISILLLIYTIENRRVFWYEAIVLVLAYCLYIIVMWKNRALKRLSERLVKKVATCCCGFRTETQDLKDEKTPLLKSNITAVAVTNFNEDLLYAEQNVSPDPSTEILSGKDETSNEEEADSVEKSYVAFSFPYGQGYWTITEWVLGWPIRLLFTLTIPDCRKPRFGKLYPLTFLMCIIYIALLSYLVTWLMTIIGFTFGIPDSVMGMTFIAAGASVPEAVSSIIVARQGLGSMSISNSIGSNIFDILICLGLPWLIRSSMIANEVEGNNFIQINSGGIEYSVISLIISVLLLYGLLAANGFYLDKKVATIATILYAIFLLFSVLLELNVFFQLNQPMCTID